MAIMLTIMVAVFAVSRYNTNLLKPKIFTKIISGFSGTTEQELPARNVTANVATNTNKVVDAKTVFDNHFHQNQLAGNSKTGNNKIIVASNSRLSNQFQTSSFSEPAGTVSRVGNSQPSTMSSTSNVSGSIGVGVANVSSASTMSGKATVASSTTASTNSPIQKVGGKPAEPGVSSQGTLPLGDGTWILLLLGLSYVVRRSVKLA
jgi:hypothetical protein